MGDRPRQKKCTAKNKLLPRSQQNRLHHKKVTKKETKTCLKVNEIDFTIRRALQKKICLKVIEIDLTNEGTHQKGSKQKSKGELEKLKDKRPFYITTNQKPPYSHITTLAIKFIQP